jgi:hypothetical protein
VKIEGLVAAEFQNNPLPRKEELKVRKEFSDVENYRSRIDKAEGFSGVWEIVKETVKVTFDEQRLGMLLFLDDLPLHLGAYHPLGTNNIVLNRRLVNIVKAVTKSRKILNAFIYSILTHEYLHALGHISEIEVRSLVFDVSKASFGEHHLITILAEKSPWILNKQAIEIVKDFENPNHGYIV